LFHIPAQPQLAVASAEQPPAMLPETGSSLPLAGRLGILAIGLSIMLGAARRVYAL
jgi:hypothetical protein